MPEFLTSALIETSLPRNRAAIMLLKRPSSV